MKTRNKALLLALCAVLLVASTVFGTLAYLTDTEKAVNTFTVGKVDITMDEQKVTEYGVATADTTRVQANTYKLLPGHEYTKDPTIHFQAGSEESYLFVKVENGIAAIEKAGDTTIAAQLTTNGWTALEGVANVYTKVAAKNDTDAAQDYKIIEKFVVDGEVKRNTLAAYGNATVTITAYAVQKDGLDTAKAAWDATFATADYNSDAASAG